MSPYKRVLFLIGLVCFYVNGFAQAPSLMFELKASSAEFYAHPHDIVLHPNNQWLYVADVGNDRIAVLDAESLDELGAFAQSEVVQPHDVVFDHNGRLLVADTGNSRIAIFELHGFDGTLVGSVEEHLSRPEGVMVTKGGLILATGAGSNNLVVYQDKEIVAEVDGFSAPHDVELDQDGNIWIADAGNDRMVRLNQKLQIERILSGDDYNFNGPRYMDFDSAGRLYVADKYSNQIKIIDAQGDLVGILGEKQEGKGEGVFNRPEGVEIRNHDLWFSDTYNNRIVRYRVRSATD